MENKVEETVVQSNEEIKAKARGNSAFVWKFLERFGVYFVQFAVSIVLARILGPERYGSIAIVNIFIAFATVFVQNGLNSAIIQRKNLDKQEVASVFYINIILATFLYACLFFVAPWVAKIYDSPQLCTVLRILGLMLLPCSVTTIQTAMIEKTFRFKKLFFCSFTAVILSGTAGIVAAVMGMGVWALVIQQMVYRVSVMLALLLAQRWFPKPYISWTKAKPLMRFGWKILLAALIDVGYKNVRELLIGWKYGKEDLAHYDKGKRFPEMLVSNVNGSIQSVLLPKLSAHQDDRAEIKKIVKRVIKVTSFFIVPMMVGFALVAEPVIDVLLGDEWRFCVPYLRWFCFAFAFWPLHTANLQAITATGHSNYVLILEIIKKAMGVAIILATIWFGPLVMAAGYAASSLVSAIINAFPNKKIIGYSIFEQVKDILPCVLCAAVMGGVVFAISLLPLASIWILLLQIGVGVLLYIALALLLRLETAMIGWNWIKKKREPHRIDWSNKMLINKRKIGVCILLSIVTLGVYQMYWQYLLVKNTREIKKGKSSCLGEMLCLLFVPFYSLFWWFTRGKIVKDSFAEHGYSASGNESVYLLQGILGFTIISMAIMQNDFNSLKSESTQSI